MDETLFLSTPRRTVASSRTKTPASCRTASRPLAIRTKQRERLVTTECDVTGVVDDMRRVSPIGRRGVALYLRSVLLKVGVPSPMRSSVDGRSIRKATLAGMGWAGDTDGTNSRYER